MEPLLSSSFRQDLQATRERVGALYEFFCRHAKLCNAHTVGFFTEDHWNNVIEPSWRDQLIAVDEECEHEWATKIRLPPGDLRDFLYRASELKLPVDADPVDGKAGSSRLVKFGMTSKKSHEVVRMTECVTRIASHAGIKQVIDVGSGKGYLSEYLAVEHGLVVVGLDSEQSNTAGAIERCRKVEKAHRGSELRRAEKLLGIGLCGVDERVLMDVGDLFDEKRATGGSFEAHAEDELQSATNSTVPLPCRTDSVNHDQRPLLSTAKPPFRPLLRPLERSYTALTRLVTPDLPLLSLAEEVSEGKMKSSNPTLLVGLHTCGDLASTALRLFVNTDALSGVCVVGCCYNHISEQSSTQSSNSYLGFPMSRYLQECKAVVGRNARMLACQSEAKFAEMTSGPSLESLFFRAVFQVILENEFQLIRQNTNSFQDISVGRIKKFTGFVDYARKAFRSLKIDDGRLSDELISKYHSSYVTRKVHLQKFVQLRAVMSPVIESLIVLDRMLYLQELAEPRGVDKLSEACFKDVWLTQLFSPSLSPRCFAICALKRL